MPRVYLSLGSNCRREASLQAALTLLGHSFGALRRSPVYDSESADALGDPYLNLVVSLDSGLDVASLRSVLRGIEHQVGRRRGEPAVVIDIDLLLYGECCGDFDGLQLPRPELLDRAYVLKPLADLAGDERHPVTGRSYREHWLAFAGVDTLRPAVLTEVHHAP